MNAGQLLHERFNPKYSHIPPVRIKGFNRVKMAQLFAEAGYKKGVEIGVADGRNSLTLCENIPGLELHCVDPWETYRENPRGGGKEQQHGNFEKAQNKLKDYNVHFHRTMSIHAAEAMTAQEEGFDFVYIDGNHKFDYVMIDLIYWNRLVKKNGIIAGHDYYRFRWAGVVDAVNAYTGAHQVNEWFIDDTRETSFMWAKEQWRR
jgi:predicted O-methyltransferase YrrM